jgi:hypothetical protein
VLLLFYLLAIGTFAAVATGRWKFRLTPTARNVFAVAVVILAYPFWVAGRTGDGADPETMPLTMMAAALVVGAGLFALGTNRPEGMVWRLVELTGMVIITTVTFVPTRITWVLPITTAVLGWVIRRAAGGDVLEEPRPPL